ncbi:MULTISPECIES: uracil-DNA glycosylase [Arthrobacter]|uniref:Uracil-DNA glycosylase n=1 Tax=Arthrobacter terricola TaxID=2547396 RepID=A0A4R5KT33_9MICC|nr:MULTISPECIES: uracil-DNA glycosylase [Arthrobacter]MBT8159872.1 uracil-DNA glycosylase [Arthrobacter sp. GN70]TDF99043.1 uracil-DNA glycosylase [Arthrobacter terricola]
MADEALFEFGSEDQSPEFAALPEAPLEALMAPDWAEALAGVEDELRSVLSFVADEVARGTHVLPAATRILRAFQQPLADVKVLVLGQDPYPTPGHAVGLSFAVSGQTRPIPRSLANIYREMESDLGLPPRIHGDLSAWTGQGVLLLNRVLSVAAGEAGSHRGKGWEAITTAAVTAVADRRTSAGQQSPLVAILWGKDAEAVQPLLDGAPAIVSAHPSPLSASRGFFGSRPFSRTNALLAEQGANPVNWELPPLP